MSFLAPERPLGAAFLVTMLIGELDLLLQAVRRVLAEGGDVPWILWLVFIAAAAFVVVIPIRVYVVHRKTPRPRLPRWADFPNVHGFSVLIPMLVVSFENAISEGRPAQRFSMFLKFVVLVFFLTLFLHVLAQQIGGSDYSAAMLGGLVIAFMAVGGSLSYSFPLLFTCCWIASIYAISLVLPSYEPALQGWLFAFARAWLAATVCAVAVFLLRRAFAVRQPLVSWGAGIAVILVAGFLQLLLLWQVDIRVFDIDGSSMSTWLSNSLASVSVGGVFLVLWALAPLITSFVADD